MYLKIQANRLRGDKAYAKSDYRAAIAPYLKWKENVIEMNDGNENCVDLMKVFDVQKLNNPITDIVDSYYIMRAGYEDSISNNI